MHVLTVPVSAKEYTRDGKTVQMPGDGGWLPAHVNERDFRTAHPHPRPHSPHSAPTLATLPSI
jgi:hypothetical protein